MSTTCTTPPPTDQTSNPARPTPGHRLRPRSSGPSAAGLTGRYRYDLRADKWWWSPEVFRLYGLTPGATPAAVQLLLAHSHPDDRPRIQRALADACTTGAPFALEHRLVRRDGQLRTAVLVGEPELDEENAVTALSGLVIDVTEGRAPAPADADDQVRSLSSEVDQLRTAMASRAAIEQAKGIVMLLMGCGDQVAFELLAHISSHTHRKVRDVATSIISSASGHGSLPEDIRAVLHDASPPGAPVH